MLKKAVGRQMKDWNTDEVLMWLESIGVGKYCENFRQQMVNGEMLQDLTEEEMIEILHIDLPLLRKQLLKKVKEEKDKVLKTVPISKKLILVLVLNQPRICAACNLENYFEITTRSAIGYPFSDLNNYSAIVFDFQDSSPVFYPFPVECQDKLLAYLKQGGSVLWTHDHIDSMDDSIYGKGRFKKDILNYCGVEWKVMGPHSYENKCVVEDLTHSIFKFPHDLSAMHTFDISLSHSSYHQVTTGKVLANFAVRGDYLVVKEQEAARCCYTAAGHTYNFTAAEKLLFVNIISWLARNS